MLTILKNTLLGSVTGLVLGGTLSLVAGEDHQGDVVRWGVVVGTFGGFALGAGLALRGEEELFSAAPASGVSDVAPMGATGSAGLFPPRMRCETGAPPYSSGPGSMGRAGTLGFISSARMPVRFPPPLRADATGR
jgi:hypothetical protein